MYLFRFAIDHTTMYYFLSFCRSRTLFVSIHMLVFLIHCPFIFPIILSPLMGLQYNAYIHICIYEWEYTEVHIEVALKKTFLQNQSNERGKYYYFQEFFFPLISYRFSLVVMLCVFVFYFTVSLELNLFEISNKTYYWHLKLNWLKSYSGSK